MASKDLISDIDVQSVGGSKATGTPPLNEKWLNTLLEAKAKQSIGAADAARNRAQAAWGIASAVALAIIGTGILTGIDSANRDAQILGGFSILLWAVASIGYLWAVGMSGTVTEGSFKAVGVNDGVSQILKASDKKRASVAIVIRGAMIATAAAMICTFAAFAHWVHYGDSKTMDDEQMAPSFVFSLDHEVFELPADCVVAGGVNISIRGELVDELTNDSSIAIRASDEGCLDEGRVVTANRSALLYVEP